MALLAAEHDGLPARQARRAGAGGEACWPKRPRSMAALALAGRQLGTAAPQHAKRHGCPCAVWEAAWHCRHSTHDAVRFTRDYCTYSPLVQQELLTPEELAIRDRVRRFAVSSAQHRAEAGPWVCSGSPLHASRLGLKSACPRLSACRCCTASLFAQLLQPPSPCSLASLPQETEIAPVIADYWERAEFPFPLVPGFQVRQLGGCR